MAKLSIAMATYNGETYLREQLDSFANQSRPPDELVVCDDQSSDRTFEILNDFRDRTPFEMQICVTKNDSASPETSNRPFVSAAGTSFSFPTKMMSGWKINCRNMSKFI